MAEFTMQLNSPITDEQWNAITDAELEHSKEIEFTTPSGKKVLFQKVRHGKWMHKEITADFHVVGQCSICKERRRIDNFCPNCGAKMKSDGEDGEIS